MSPINKKAKRESTEKELEGFLFGDASDDVWNKAGHELDQDFNKEKEEEEEEADEQVRTFQTKATLY